MHRRGEDSPSDSRPTGTATSATYQPAELDKGRMQAPVPPGLVDPQ
jgi:hypothetical protein